MQSEISKVQDFLTEICNIINDTGLYIAQRKKNLDCLAELAYTYNDVEYEVLSLTYKNYIEGPDADHSGSGEMWMFGKYIAGKLIYIKLKIDYAEGNKAKCISFHSTNNAKFPYQ